MTKRIDGVPNAQVKRLLKMKRSPSGWGQDAVVGAMVAFGFEVREGSAHTICFDPEDKRTSVSVPRSRDLRDYIVEDAVNAVEAKLQRKGLSLDDD